MADKEVEVTTEVKEPVIAAPITPATEIIAPPVKDGDTTPVQESSFDIDLDVNDEPAPATNKVKYGKDKFKDLDDDIYDGDNELEFDEHVGGLVEKLINRGKEYKTKANEYKTIAEAGKTIQNDPSIKFWMGLHDSSDEEVVKAAEYSKYIRAGRSEDDALKLAEESVNELRDESEKLFKRRAEDIRLDLQGSIHHRTKEIQNDIAKTAQALSLSSAPDKDLINKTIEKLSKTDNFLGLKIGGKNEASKKDFIKPVVEAIKDGSLLKKLQSDPELLAEIGLMVQYKDKFAKAIEKRTPAKQSTLEKLAKAPHSSGMPPLKTDIVEQEGGGLKNPTSFR